MRILVLSLVLAVGACSSPPPKPPQPEGNYRPINSKALPAHHQARFIFNGTAEEALHFIAKRFGNLDVKPPKGEPTYTQVSLSMLNPSRELALQKLAEQGKGAFKIISEINKSSNSGTLQLDYSK